jgi:hypothetical protein
MHKELRYKRSSRERERKQMLTVIVILAFSMPVLIGWLYGRNDIDPDTAEGKAYYSSQE